MGPDVQALPSWRRRQPGFHPYRKRSLPL